MHSIRVGFICYEIIHTSHCGATVSLLYCHIITVLFLILFCFWVVVICLGFTRPCSGKPTFSLAPWPLIMARFLLPLCSNRIHIPIVTLIRHAYKLSSPERSSLYIINLTIINYITPPCLLHLFRAILRKASPWTIPVASHLLDFQICILLFFWYFCF